MQKAKRPVVILALNTGSQVDELRILGEAGLKVLRSTFGSYKGQKELSYVVDVGHDGAQFGEVDRAKLETAIDVARAFSQESILFLAYDRTASLLYMSDLRAEPLGQFVAVAPRVALAQEAYTYDLATGEHWVVV
jgi:hypothetical protein